MNVRAINHSTPAVGAARAVDYSLRVVDYAPH